MNGDEDLNAAEFLVATRIQYERRSRAPHAANVGDQADHPSGADVDADVDVDVGEADGQPERDLRAAEFVLATRTQREATERAVRRTAARR